LLTMVAGPLSGPADVAGGMAVPVPSPAAAASGVLAAVPAHPWASLCEGVQQDMMLAMLGAFQGVAAACAEVCIQRMQLLHLELVHAVEHEVEEAEAKAKRDGHPSTAPIFQSLADALGQKTRLGQLCHEEPCMSERHMTRCESNATLESMCKHLGGTATPLTAELLKLVANAGSGARSARLEQPLHGPPSFHEHTTSDKELHIRPSSEGDYASADPVIHSVSSPSFSGGRGDLDRLSQTSKTVSSSWEEMPQTQQAPPQHGNRYETAASPIDGSRWTTGGAHHESLLAGDLGYDAFSHQKGGPMVMPITGNILVHPQPYHHAKGPVVMPTTGDYQWHAQIRDAKGRAKEQHAREQVQQLAKEQNCFYA